MRAAKLVHSYVGKSENRCRYDPNEKYVTKTASH